MKALTLLVVSLTVVSNCLAQEGIAVEDTVRIVTIDASLSDHSSLNAGALYGLGLAYETSQWRFPLVFGFAGPLSTTPVDEPPDHYTELSFSILGKIFSKEILLDLGAGAGRLSFSRPKWSVNTLFLSIQGELGISGERLAGGISYKRRFSQLFAGDLVGAWLRYRIKF